MALKETINEMNKYLANLTKDLVKAAKGNKAASQRVRIGTIRFAKIAKIFRKESVSAEKSGLFKKAKQSIKAKKTMRTKKGRK